MDVHLGGSYNGGGMLYSSRASRESAPGKNVVFLQLAPLSNDSLMPSDFF